MSKATELNRDGHESAANGSIENKFGDAEPVGIEGDEGEESDDYEEIDEEEERQEERQLGEGEDEDEEDDESEEDDKQGPNTLTHLLLGNTNGATAENEAEYEEDEEDDDEDDDDEYVEDDEEEGAAPPNPLGKKRSIDEVADGEASQGSKKIKA